MGQHKHVLITVNGVPVKKHPITNTDRSTNNLFSSLMYGVYDPTEIVRESGQNMKDDLTIAYVFICRSPRSYYRTVRTAVLIYYKNGRIVRYGRKSYNMRFRVTTVRDFYDKFIKSITTGQLQDNQGLDLDMTEVRRRFAALLYNSQSDISNNDDHYGFMSHAVYGCEGSPTT